MPFLYPDKQTSPTLVGMSPHKGVCQGPRLRWGLPVGLHKKQVHFPEGGHHEDKDCCFGIGFSCHP
jgi:hypothetical protein